ncbi:hypothetical protein [Bradyrhizobium jicamae]|uniref:putative quinol monooxygenase n=1 Tax=Bradyrhizobium jicamae TaxID=280332 RepID=UPI00289BE049|nr:hypothetical protein [Bradyrhizobium jicamae]
MAVTYLIKFNVVPDQRSRFLALLQDVLDAMRSEPMFHEAVLHCDPASDCRFMLYDIGRRGTKRYPRCWRKIATSRSGGSCAPIARRERSDTIARQRLGCFLAAARRP